MRGHVVSPSWRLVTDQVASPVSNLVTNQVALRIPDSVTVSVASVEPVPNMLSDREDRRPGTPDRRYQTATRQSLHDLERIDAGKPGNGPRIVQANRPFMMRDDVGKHLGFHFVETRAEASLERALFLRQQRPLYESQPEGLPSPITIDEGRRIAKLAPVSEYGAHAGPGLLT